MRASRSSVMTASLMWSKARAWRRIVSSIRRMRVTSWKLQTRPTVRPADLLGRGVALEHPPVLEVEPVVALGLGLRRRGPGPSGRSARGRAAGRARRPSPRLSSRAAMTSSGMRHISANFRLKLTIAALVVDDEDAVGRGLERRLEQRERLLDALLGLLALGHVAEAPHAPDRSCRRRPAAANPARSAGRPSARRRRGCRRPGARRRS